MVEAAFWEPLSEEQKQELYKDVGATEETLRRDVASVRQWLALQPHLPRLEGTGLDADCWIKMRLLRCKNSVERTKETLESLMTGRSTIPEFFQRGDPMAADIQQSFEATLMATMPKLTPDGYRVHYYAYPSTDASGFHTPALFRRVIMKAELAMRDDLSRGEIIVIDLANGNVARLREFTLSVALFSKFVGSGLKMYPARLKRIYLVNMPSYLAIAMNFLKQVLKEKLFNRIVVDPTGTEMLHKDLPLYCIPQDFGGKGPSVREGHDMWKKYIEANREWLMEQVNIKSDESKRVGTTKFIDDTYQGCPGSFRNLAVD